MRNPEILTMENVRAVAFAFALGTGSAALVGCSDTPRPEASVASISSPSSTAGNVITTPSAVVSPGETAPTSAPAVPPVSAENVCTKDIDQYTSSANLVFDYLDGNDLTVQVYPCVAPEYRGRSNGGYDDGESRVAVCQTTGREVTSVPPETPYSSNIWYRIYGIADQVTFATDTYVTAESRKELQQLEQC